MRSSSVDSRSFTPAPSSSSCPASPTPTTASLAETPPTSDVERDNTPGPYLPPPSTPRAKMRFSSAPPIHLSGTSTSSSNPPPKPNVLTRSASRSSLHGEPTRSDSRASIGVSCCPETDRPWFDLIFVPQNPDDPSSYKRDSHSCRRTDSEKRAGLKFETAWFSSHGPDKIEAPPPAVCERDDLKLGDLFCHWYAQCRKPQVWVWVKVTGGRQEWKAITFGYERPEDGRVLTLGDNKKPVFITREWQARKEKEQDSQRKRYLKGKNRGELALASSAFPLH